MTTKTRMMTNPEGSESGVVPTGTLLLHLLRNEAPSFGGVEALVILFSTFVLSFLALIRTIGLFS